MRSCPVHVDAWSHHPYTNGGPFTKQGSPDGVSMGDLPKMSEDLERGGSLRERSSREEVDAVLGLGVQLGH